MFKELNPVDDRRMAVVVVSSVVRKTAVVVEERSTDDSGSVDRYPPTAERVGEDDIALFLSPSLW